MRHQLLIYSRSVATKESPSMEWSGAAKEFIIILAAVRTSVHHEYQHHSHHTKSPSNTEYRKCDRMTDWGTSSPIKERKKERERREGGESKSEEKENNSIIQKNLTNLQDILKYFPYEGKSHRNQTANTAANTMPVGEHTLPYQLNTSEYHPFTTVFTFEKGSHKKARRKERR